MAEPTTAEEKIKVFDEWMKGDHVLLHIDSRRPGVEVPESCQQNYALVLKVSYLFAGETKRTDTGVSAYLKFSGQYEHCMIPWTAIWGITSGDGRQRVWQNELPPEVVVQLAVDKLKEVGRRVLRKPKPAEKAKAVEPERPPEPPTPSDPPEPTEPRPRGHLRRVK